METEKKIKDMVQIIINVWFFILFIPGIYIIYKCMQCFDFEKVLKKGQVRNFKILYIIISIIISFLFALTFTTVIEKIYEIGSNLMN